MENSSTISAEKFVKSFIFFNGFSPDIFKKMTAYIDAVYEWGNIHNISSKKYDKNDLWESLYDSIFCLELINKYFFSDNFLEKSVIDAGSGGGFPGVPLAILFNEKKFNLVDSDRKKCSFLRLLKAKIALDNVVVVNDMLERVPLSYLVISKAAFSPPNVGGLARSIAPGGKLLLWSTPLSATDFIDALQVEDCLLLDQSDYSLPSNKRRRILVFSKAY